MERTRNWLAIGLLVCVAVASLVDVGRAAAPGSMEVGLVSADVRLLGEQLDGWAAYSTSPAGDVNGDGYADVLIGAPLTRPGSAGEPSATTGKVYLLLGRPRDQWPAGPINLREADASFDGCPEAGTTGRQNYTAGDVNGDGYADFLISGWKCSSGASYQGKTFLFLGRPNADWGQGFPVAQADASFLGEHSMDFAGYYVATTGDVNGDGYDDFLITCPECDYGSQDDRGEVYLILGRAAVDWGASFPLSNADASFVGEVPGDRVGRSASGVGDVNGDGFDDFLIGSIASDEAAVDAGQSYLILGRAAADWGLRYSLSLADASFAGEAEADESGRRVAQAGDVNADGYADFLIGASRNDEAGTDAGKAYLILGRAAADWGMDYALSQADASFVGEEAGDQAGRRVSGIGDFDHDGFADLLLGAPHNSRVAEWAGAAYLIFGRAAADWGRSYPLEYADAIYVGEVAQDVAGYDVAAAGDIDGDGRDDFLIGAFGGRNANAQGQAAPDAAAGADSPGKAYILFSHAGEAPGVPKLVTPADGTVAKERNVEFKWRAGGGGLPSSFRVYLDSAAYTVYGTSWNQPLESGTHTWQVRASNDYGSSGWTQTWTVQVSDVSPEIFVGNITMTYRLLGENYRVRALVPVWEAGKIPAAGATVTAQWTLPDGSMSVGTAVTSAKGAARFSCQSTQAGLYTLAILDVQQAGYEYDPAMNRETSEEIRVP